MNGLNIKYVSFMNEKAIHAAMAKKGSKLNRLPFQFWKPMRRHPKLMYGMVRGAYKKYVTANRAHARVDGTSDALWLISMRITARCNHRCAICGQQGVKGYNRLDNIQKPTDEVPLETYMKMVDEVKHLKPHIYITGGEPFLYKDLIPLVRYMKKNGLSVQVVTNGVGLERHAEAIVDDEWDMLCVSIDGPKEIHDKCRGLVGAYDTMQKGMRKIQKLKKEKKKKYPTFYSLSTLSETNQANLMDTLREAEALEPDVIGVYYSWFTSEEVGCRHSEIIKKELGVEPFAWKSYARDMSGMDPKVIAETVGKVKKTKFKAPVVFIPQIQPDEIEEYYHHPESFLGWKKCLAPWFQVDIMPNGDVVNCRDFPDIHMGNMQQTPILEIYNGEMFRKYRKALAKQPDGVFPLCSRCCGLMGY
jgi:MoaA/NifB/PqqE/SkfB family radical SAM enzyme